MLFKENMRNSCMKNRNTKREFPNRNGLGKNYMKIES